MDDAEKKRANLRVLQRLDHSIKEIECSATHVVLYEFCQSKQHWEKKNVEGSLFVTRRGDEPRYKLLVLNRSSTENLEVFIGPHFQMQVREPYLIFRSPDENQESTIRGLWFHDGDERTNISNILQKFVNDQKRLSETASNQVDPSSQSQQSETVSAPSSAPPNNKMDISNTPKKNSDVEDFAKKMLSPLSAGPDIAGGDGVSALNDNMVLDKKSLQLSLLALIQDERFLDLIHAQYKKVAQLRASKSPNDDKN